MVERGAEVVESFLLATDELAEALLATTQGAAKDSSLSVAQARALVFAMTVKMARAVARCRGRFRLLWPSCRAAYLDGRVALPTLPPPREGPPVREAIVAGRAAEELAIVAGRSGLDHRPAYEFARACGAIAASHQFSLDDVEVPVLELASDLALGRCAKAEGRKRGATLDARAVALAKRMTDAGEDWQPVDVARRLRSHASSLLGKRDGNDRCPMFALLWHAEQERRRSARDSLRARAR